MLTCINYNYFDQLINQSLSDEIDNYCYCLLEGDAVKDNGILQRTHQFFMQKVSLKYASLNFSANKPSLRYELINNVTSLADVFEITCVKFLDFLANHPMRNSIYLPLHVLIREFNMRVDKLVKFLTNDSYKSLTWPIPEMIDHEQNINANSSGTSEMISQQSNSLWTLKYWNTNECFDHVLSRQFVDLVRLEEFSIDFESDKSDGGHVWVILNRLIQTHLDKVK